MNAITKTESTALEPMTEQDLMKVLQSSLYPGAAPESIKMVLGYCRAAGLDPILKPVHIVPMYAATEDKDQKGRAIKAMRDVIMPGIGLYRIQAARTGQYAGQDAPVFGPMVEATFQVKKTEWRNGQATDSYVEKTIAYPEWCSITIYRLIGGFRSAFTAVEFWTENYATAGRDTDAPNEMWSRRVRGQLSKCAEAQALRKAFPEVGQAPTAEEMEGKPIRDMGHVEGTGNAIDHAILEAARAAASQGVAAYQEYWKGAGAETRKALAAEHPALKQTAIDADKARTVSEQPAQQDNHDEVTLAMVMAKINAAKNEDALNVACDWASALASDEDRKAAEARYDQRLEEMRAAQ